MTILFMMISSILYVNIKHYDIYKSAIVIIICLYKAVDALADVYEGWFQQKERLDLAGKAVVGKIVIGVISFGGALYISGNLLVSCAILFGGYTLGFFLFDVLYYTALKERIKSLAACSDKKWIAELFVVGLPLFINAYLMMDIINEPKMVIDTVIENRQLPNGAQASFNILFMPASVLTLAYIVFRPLLTKMAIYWTQKRKKNF